ncbi:MAG: MFS family permease [Alphaproteobacteria bacterium]|jgi:MFS family permease
MQPRVSNPVAIIALMCVCEVLTTLDVFAFAALLPHFGESWALSKTELGWISGIFFAGYTIAVPVLVSLTDRIDARPIYMAGAATIAIASVCFAVVAEGFWTAMIFRFLAGAGFAGAYMPGLRVLVDRYAGGNQGRAVAFYTGFFSLGVGMSYLTAGEVQSLFGWRMVFWTTAASATLAVILVGLLLRPVKPAQAAQASHLLDFRPVLRDRNVMGYVLCYGVHAWELLGLRAWIVAFLTFNFALNAGSWLAPTQAAAIGALLAISASIIGGELAVRFNRRRVIGWIMSISALMACGIGFGAGLPYGVLVSMTFIYILFVQGESAALTAGTLASAPVGRQGATLAVHTMCGFTGGFFGPLVFGVVLDHTGGGASVESWGFAFISIGVAVGMGPLLLVMTRARPTRI